MTHSKLYEHTVYCIPIIIPTLQFTRKDHVYVDGPCQKIGLSELARQDQGLLTVEHFFSIFFFFFFCKKVYFWAAEARMESTRNKGGTFSHGMNEICRGNLRMWVLFSGKRFTINITFLKKKKKN